LLTDRQRVARTFASGPRRRRRQSTRSPSSMSANRR
jgi:hypothetical protein